MVKTAVYVPEHSPAKQVEPTQGYGWDPRCNDDEPCWPSETSTSFQNVTMSSVDLTQDATSKKAYEAYCKEISKPDEEIDMLATSAYIAQMIKYPSVQPIDLTRSVDWLAQNIRAKLPEDGRYPMRVLRAVIAELYVARGFHGNAADYYSDDNSFINMVLSERKGIPVTLGLVFSEVAKRVGLPMIGLNLPTHFMLQPDVEGMEVLVDAFSGEILFKEEAEERLGEMMGATVEIDPKLLQGRHGCSKRAWLARMLYNLKAMYLGSNADQESALRVIRLLRATQPNNLADLRDEGLTLYSLRRYAEAAEAMQAYLDAEPSAEDAGMVATMLTSCRALARGQMQ